MSAVQGVNLLSPARRAHRLRRRRVARWSGGLTLYGAALVAVWIIAHVGGAGADRTVAAELAAARDRIERAEQTLRELRPELAEARNVLAASRAVGNQPNWSLLLGVLAELLDDHTVLMDVQMEPERAQPWSSRSRQADAQQTARGPYELRLSGFGQSQAAVQAYLLRLERTGLFETVTLVDTRTAPFRGDEAVGFRIDCRLGVPLERVAEEQASEADASAGDGAPLALPNEEAVP